MTEIKAYANAKDVLPAAIYEVVQKHFTGLMYVPRSGMFYKERRQLVLSLKEQNISSAEIAKLAGITVRRVNQIVKGVEK